MTATLSHPFVNVADLPCPDCKRLVCDDYLTCSGYLRSLCDRLGEPQVRGVRERLEGSSPVADTASAHAGSVSGFRPQTPATGLDTP